MADCTITEGYGLDCRISGGMDTAYISDLVKGQVYGFVSGEIIGGTDNATGSIMTFQTLEQEIETSSATEVITPSTENGTVYYEQSIILKFFGNSDSLRTFVKNIARGRFTMICKDQEGQDKLYGKQNGLRVSEGDISTGLAFGDLNGVNITLMAKEPQPANLVDLAGDGPTADIDEFVIIPAPVAP